MVQGNAILVVDLGNSSTKCKVLFGKDSSTGRYRERKFEISNVFAPIEEGYVVSPDYKEDTSTILKVDTTLNGRVIKGNFCNGELQIKEKPLSTIKPSASDKKYNLDSTVLSYRLAFLQAFKAVMSMQRISDWTQLDLSWTVVTLLPPGDLDEGTDKIKSIIENIKSVESAFPALNLSVKLDKVKVLPEGYCAYAGVVYESGMKFRDTHKFLKNETVLVIDIGAGTTDILLIKDNKLVQSSKYTITQGGNNVYQQVRLRLRMKGLDLDAGVIKDGVITGSVRDGSKSVDITDYVNTAKSDIAQKIVSEIQDFLDLTDIKVRSVGYVLICGGGSMSDSTVSSIVPLSDKVIESFKQLAPNSELVSIPVQTLTKEDDTGEPYKVEESISPRELNLIGASILAEVL